MLKSAVSGTRFSRRKQRVPIPGPGTARRKKQLASGCTGVCFVFCRCCVTYVRGPDLKAGLHFSIRAQVGISAWLVLCRESGGYLSRLAVLSFESVHGPRLYPAQDLPQFGFRRDREGDLRFGGGSAP